MGRIDVIAADVAEQEIGSGGAGVGAVEGELAARGAGLAEGDATAVDLASELEKMPASLPGESVGEWSDGVRADSRPNLPLQVVHVIDAVGAADGDRRRSIFFGEPGHQGQPHLPDYVERRVVGGTEDFRFIEAMPSAACFVDQRRPDQARPGDGDVLGAPEVIALVVTPDRRASFIGVVENVAAGDLVLGRQVVIDASGEVLLLRDGALGRGESASEMDVRKEGVEQLIAMRSLARPDRGQDHQQEDQDRADEQAQPTQHSTSADPLKQ